jgi:hypothetical protein
MTRVEADRAEFFHKAKQIVGRTGHLFHPPQEGPAVRAAQERAQAERTRRGQQAEQANRRHFQHEGAKGVGQPLLDIIQGVSEASAPDPHEVVGDIPGTEFGPVQVVFEKHELNPPSSRVTKIRQALHLHNLGKELHEHRRLVIAATTATGGIAAVIGGFYAVRHYIESHPHHDITDH